MRVSSPTPMCIFPLDSPFRLHINTYLIIKHFIKEPKLIFKLDLKAFNGLIYKLFI
jgi:hypothetical protein